MRYIEFLRGKINMHSYFIVKVNNILRAGMAESVERPAGLFGIRIPVGARNFSLLQNTQTVSGAHPTYCLVSTAAVACS
jgi:hypothetical protein